MKPRSWATVPTRFSSEERREWKEWLEDPKGTDINKNRFTCAGPTSWGTRIDDIDELYERMVKRGVVASTPEEAFVNAQVYGIGILKIEAPPSKKKRRGRR